MNETGEHLRIKELTAEVTRLRAELEAVRGNITPCPNCDGSGRNAQGDCCRIPGHARQCKCILCQWKNACNRNENEANSLRIERGALKSQCDDLCRDVFHAAEQDIKIAALEAQMAGAREALEIYANDFNFVEGNDWFWKGDDDPTITAKNALAALSPEATKPTEYGSTGPHCVTGSKPPQGDGYTTKPRTFDPHNPGDLIDRAVAEENNG